jgi:predicted transglutaminase-like cysteine proteinase
MPSNTFLSVLIIAGVLMGAVQSAAAVDLSNPAFTIEGKVTAVPIGHYQFCRATPTECTPNDAPVDATALTDANWQDLVAVNSEVNAAVAPVTDIDQYNVEEYWTYPQSAGDCEDYVLAKRRALMNQGWAASTLLIAVVRQQSGAGHAVLLARTDRGDLVLDNQDGDIHVWNETPYTYLKRQSQTDSGAWVDIIDQRPVLVAAVH